MARRLNVNDYRRRRLFGAWLQQQRLKAGLTQAELGRRLSSDSDIVSKYESGIRLVSRNHIVPMMEQLKVSKREFSKQYLMAANYIIYQGLFGRGPKGPDERLAE